MLLMFFHLLLSAVKQVIHTETELQARHGLLYYVASEVLMMIA